MLTKALLTRRHFGLTALVASGMLLAGCSTNFAISYDDLPKETAQSWTVTKVVVVAPDTLSVSEADSYVPSGDIVWRGDPPGDRRAQVAAIVKAGVIEGTKSLKGPIPVFMDVQVTRFHALSIKSYLKAPYGTGVNSTDFIITVRRASDGEILQGPTKIESDFPAKLAIEVSGDQGAAAYGSHAKPEITGQVAAVVRGWLGIGPDIRGKFSRLGG